MDGPILVRQARNVLAYVKLTFNFGLKSFGISVALKW